jgi:hypothetical protein
MRKSSVLIAAVASIVGIGAPLTSLAPSTAQAPAPTTGPALGKPCNTLSDLVQANPPKDPPELTPVDEKNKRAILDSGLPCQETVSASGPDKNHPGKKKTPLENRQRGFDFYSWLTFIALNSPADERHRIDDALDAKAKWEDPKYFKQLLDVMTGKPSNWEDPALIPSACRSQYKPGMMVIQMIEESFNQPFKTGALIDQQGNYAIFDILMNRPMFDYIQEHHLHSKAGQMDQVRSGLKVDFPAGINPKVNPKVPNGDPGGIIVKVSWKVIDSPADKQRLHTADALVSLPRLPEQKSEPPCLHKTLGLVGFHVMHKTQSRLQWIWTSFEHVDNVPEQTEVDNGRLKRSYSFYDPSCPRCPVNQTPPRPWDPTPANGLKFHSGFKSQITRTLPLTDATKKMNSEFQGILGNTVWKNYMLLSTQWPSAFPCAGQTVKTPPSNPGVDPDTDFKKEPDMTCAPAPTYLANSTLETYSQGSVPLASSSCMACHGNAVSYQQRAQDDQREERLFNQSDFTFMLEKAP